MKQSDIVIIGGSAAGIPAAITCRRHYPEKNVMLIRKEKQAQIPCGIPYIYGTVDSPENNLIPDNVITSNGIELLVDNVEKIDREKKSIFTGGGETIVYDKLVLATGSLPLELLLGEPKRLRWSCHSFPQRFRVSRWYSICRLILPRPLQKG